MALCFIIVMLLLLVAYTVLIESYRRWFLQIQPLHMTTKNPVTFSVIIAARNEAGNIDACLLSVLNQQYPENLFEVIVVDDYSIDDTAKKVEFWQKSFRNLRLLQLQKLLPDQRLNSYKKKAIELGIQHAMGEWIVTTDADCIVKENWLQNFANLSATKDAVFIAAPVKIINNRSFLSVFQCLDFISLQGITAASVYKGFHSMCNGANLAYRKDIFNAVNGFAGIDNIASGDDMLLMHKISIRHPHKVHYLFSEQSIVCTQPMNHWRDFFNQRIRWASKADKYDDKRIFAVLLLVYLFNLSFIVLAVAAVWQLGLFWFLLLFVIAKTITELRFMVPVANFFGEEKLLWWFPAMQPFHILYTVIAGWLGKFGKYSWKGRIVK